LYTILRQNDSYLVNRQCSPKLITRSTTSKGVINNMNNVLTSRNLNKSFGSTIALRDVSFSISAGERVAVLGENGAGKSTLMKIFSGAILPDSGSMSLFDNDYSPKTPKDAISNGVVSVYQEPFFFPPLTVIENLLLGQNMKSKVGFLNQKYLNNRARYLISKVKLPESILGKKMGSLSLAEQQLILIARAVEQETKLLILDEPTSILTDTEAERLFRIVNDLATNGTAICYITHRFDELERVADRFVVMRDGEVTGDLLEPSREKILKLMSESDSTHFDFSQKITIPKTVISRKSVLKVSNLSSNERFHEINFEVKQNEIVGLYGLIGSGRTEIAKAIFGEFPINSGLVHFNERIYIPVSSSQALTKGIAYLPEDRKTQGILQYLSIDRNITISILHKIRTCKVIKRKKEFEKSSEAINRFSIKTNNSKNLITSLSGGNQQKTLLSRLFLTLPKLMILDEPTRGIDIGTKNEVHNLILDIAQNDTAILLITSELSELVKLSDKVVVLRRGKVIVTLNKEEINEERILAAATGILE
jgi:ABC-type sugar transport system ATPase subunit